MKVPYLNAIRIIFILLSCYLIYIYLQPFFPYYQRTRDYALIVIFFMAIPCVLVYMESRVKQLFTQELILGLFGLVCGLATSALILLPLSGIIPEENRAALQIGIHLLLGYFGAVVGVRSAHRLDFTTSKFVTPSERHLLGAKFIDTSVLIDGRIADIAKTGFLEGLFVVPTFVTEELQALADSRNHLKRNRGHRGMEILASLQGSSHIDLEILPVDPHGADTVDQKLLALAKQHSGTVFTVDFNLSKIAEIEQIQVVNINQLSQSMMRVILPGEHLRIHILREGREDHQGVGYLEDGTMVVVEHGRGRIGKEATVEVASILQTASGQMVFARMSTDRLGADEHNQLGAPSDEPSELPKTPPPG
ncbi:MAG: PIN domain-containing protein [bacterium]